MLQGFAVGPVWLLVGIIVLAAGAVIGWAFTAVFTPPRDVLSETAFTMVELVNGEVGASIGLNAVAEWMQGAGGHEPGPRQCHVGVGVGR